MATSTGIPDLQTAIGQIEQIGVAAASPFIKSAEGKQTEQKVVAEVNLGVAALPLLGNLFQSFAAAFHNIGGLFHHMHKMASPPPPPSAPDLSAGDGATE